MNLFDEGENILQCTSKSLLIDRMITSRQMADKISSIIRVVFVALNQRQTQIQNSSQTVLD